MEKEKNELGPNGMVCCIILIIMNVLMYFVCSGNSQIVESAGTDYYDVIVRGDYGRLISSMFVHSGIVHIASNMLALFVFGEIVERDLGAFNMTIIYFVSGIGSGIFSCYLYYALQPNVINYSVGASGAIFGIMAAGMLRICREEKNSMAKSVGSSIVACVIYAIVTCSVGVDIFGHIGGAVFGAIISSILTKRYSKDYKEGKAKKVIGIILVVILSLGFAP